MQKYVLVFPHTGLLFIGPPKLILNDVLSCPVISRPKALSTSHAVQNNARRSSRGDSNVLPVDDNAESADN